MGDSSFGVIPFCPFIQVMRFSLQVYWGGLLFPPMVLDDTTVMAESEEELKSLLIRVKEESERVGLKLSIKEN